MANGNFEKPSTITNTPPKRVFITGCSGLLGSTALLELSKKYDCLGVYNAHPIGGPQLETLQLDLTDTEKLWAVLQDFQPTHILHTAALTNIDLCESNKEQAFTLNAHIPKKIAEFSEKLKSHLIHISTDAFFSSSQKFHSESEIPTPLNTYGESKWAAEKFISEKTQNATIIRTNIFGWNYQKKLSFSEWIYSALKEQITIPLVDDVFFNPVTTNTLVKCIEKILYLAPLGVLNIASNDRLSKYEFAMKFCSLLKLEPQYIQKVKHASLKLKAPRSHNMCLDNSRVKSLFPDLSFNIADEILVFKATEGYFNPKTFMR